MTIAEIKSHIEMHLTRLAGTNKGVQGIQGFMGGEVYKYINEAYRLFLDRTNLLESSATITITAGVGTLPADCNKVIRLEYSDGTPINGRVQRRFYKNDVESSEYSYYIKSDETGAEKLYVYDDSNDALTGSVVLYYSRTFDTDTTTELNEPTIPKRFHMALVFGALWLMGFADYERMFNVYVKQGQANSTRTGTAVIWPPFY